MKKSLCIMLGVSLMAAVLTGCGGKKQEAQAPETAAETTAAETTAAETEAPETTAAEAETQEAISSGMPNPVRDVADPNEYLTKLGIWLSPYEIAEDTTNLMIDDRLASIVWTETQEGGEETEYVLRATMDKELAPSMTGIYASDFTEPVEQEIKLTDDKSVTVSYTETKNEGNCIYTWKEGNIYYSLSSNKPAGREAMEEVLSRAMKATGIAYHTGHVDAIRNEEDLHNTVTSAAFDKTAIIEKSGVYSVECELFGKEYFDIMDIDLLQSGDTITVDGDMVIEIASVTRDEDGNVFINGGLDEEGFELRPEGGAYVVCSFNDAASYASKGKLDLEFKEDVKLTDTADIENGCKECVIEGAAEVVKHLQEKEYIYTNFRSTTIRTENGQIAEMYVRYTP